MQEYEHFYVDLVEQDAQRAAVEIDHERCLLELRRACSCKAYASSTGIHESEMVCDDFRQHYLVDDPVASDFRYLWDVQDEAYLYYVRHGGAAFPEVAPWPELPFLAAPDTWALDEEPPSIVEDAAWRRQLVSLRSALDVARSVGLNSSTTLQFEVVRTGSAMGGV